MMDCYLISLPNMLVPRLFFLVSSSLPVCECEVDVGVKGMLALSERRSAGEGEEGRDRQKDK